MFIGMGFVHIFASLLLAIFAGDQVIIWSQFIGGLVELAIGFYWFINFDEVI